MRKLLHLLGFIWLLPATILVWLFYVLPLWVSNNITYHGSVSGTFFIFKFRTSKNKSNWYAKAWKDWAGWSGPCVIIFRHDCYDDSTLLHELRHCKQQFVFGILHYPIYLLSSALIWLFISNRHAYLDNPFERDARKAAGQMVDIPREYWMHGPDDRWPFW